MSTNNAVLTPEQQAVIKLYTELNAALGKARLAQTHDNGYILAAELNKRGIQLLNATVKDLLKVIDDILYQDKLEWVPGFEPAKLKAGLPGQKPPKLENPIKLEQERTDMLRSSEAAAAKSATDKAAEKQCDEVIGSYMPTRRSVGGEVLDFRERENARSLWASVKASVLAGKSIQVNGRNGEITLTNIQECARWMVENAAWRYKIQERAKERM
jgi:hypothetical protein